MHVRSLSLIAATASVAAASALAHHDAPPDQAPRPLATREALPPAAVPESRARWLARLVTHITKYKRYPYGLEEDRGGDVVITFLLDRTGHVVSARVVKTSGDTILDDAALAMVQRADPVPQPPQQVTDEGLNFVLPVRFVPRSTMCTGNTATAELCEQHPPLPQQP
jgi:TonB family protein